MNGQLLKVFSPLVSIARSKGYKTPGGIRYPGGITYYPRYPDHKDPEYTPSKLFRVQRIKSAKGFPYWQKSILRELHILDTENSVAIVKNIPEVNSKLWRVKHLIKVTPITFPYGEPSKDDINYTVMKENGECLVIKKLEQNPEQVKARELYDNDKKKMDSETLKRDSRLKWVSAFTGGF